MEKIMNSRWFNIASWGITALIVAVLFGFAFLHMQSPTVAVAAPAATIIVSGTPQAAPVNADVNISFFQQPAIERKLTLRTIIPLRPRYTVITHTVEHG